MPKILTDEDISKLEPLTDEDIAAFDLTQKPSLSDEDIQEFDSKMAAREMVVETGKGLLRGFENLGGSMGAVTRWIGEVKQT